MAQALTFELEGKCEHGVVTKHIVPLPLTVEILGADDEEYDAAVAEIFLDLKPDIVPPPLPSPVEFLEADQSSVWLVSRTDEGQKWYLLTVSEPSPCTPLVEITAAAFKSLLSTPEGEAQANRVHSPPVERTRPTCTRKFSPTSFSPPAKRETSVVKLLPLLVVGCFEV